MEIIDALPINPLKLVKRRGRPPKNMDNDTDEGHENLLYSLKNKVKRLQSKLYERCGDKKHKYGKQKKCGKNQKMTKNPANGDEDEVFWYEMDVSKDQASSKNKEPSAIQPTRVAHEEEYFVSRYHGDTKRVQGPLLEQIKLHFDAL